MEFVKEEMVRVLSEIAEWNDLLKAIETTIIKEVTNKDGAVWYLKTLNIVVKLLNDAIPLLTTAIDGSGNIPAQWAETSTKDKIMFFTNIVIEHAMTIVSAIFDEPKV